LGAFDLSDRAEKPWLELMHKIMLEAKNLNPPNFYSRPAKEGGTGAFSWKDAFRKTRYCTSKADALRRQYGCVRNCPKPNFTAIMAVNHAADKFQSGKSIR
jgi:hypothetical protein